MTSLINAPYCFFDETIFFHLVPQISSFQSFTELIILKVLEAHRDSEKDVSEILLFFSGDIDFNVEPLISPTDI